MGHVYSNIMPNTNQRLVVVTIDTILAVLRDYAGGEIPADAQAVSFQLNPREKNKFMLVIDSPSYDKQLPPMILDFDIRRFYGVGSGNSQCNAE